VDAVEVMMGHEGYLTDAYRRYSPEDLAEYYRKGKHSLQVLGDDAEVALLKQGIESGKKQTSALIEAFANKNRVLEERVASMERILEEVAKRVRFEIGSSRCLLAGNLLLSSSSGAASRS